MRRPRWNLRTLLWLPVGSAALFAYASRIETSETNCGGNTEALCRVRDCLRACQIAAYERPDHRFSVAGATTAERVEFTQIARGMMSGGRILISTAPYVLSTREPRRIIAVCERPFTNVPRRAFGSPPTHAVAYTDETMSLISVAEYASLNLSSYVPLDELPVSTGPWTRGF